MRHPLFLYACGAALCLVISGCNFAAPTSAPLPSTPARTATRVSPDPSTPARTATRVSPVPSTPTRTATPSSPVPLKPTRTVTPTASRIPTRTRTPVVTPIVPTAVPPSATPFIPSPTVAPTPVLTETPNDTGAQQSFAAMALERVNAARSAENLPPLALETTLIVVAQARSRDMIARNYFAHQDPEDGQLLYEKALRSMSFRYGWAGENLAQVANQGGDAFPELTQEELKQLAELFIARWLESPGHRANILNIKFRRMGIAVTVSPDRTRFVATQIFSD